MLEFSQTTPRSTERLSRSLSSCLHNGDYIKHATGIRIPLLDQFRAEAKTAALCLGRLPVYKSLYELACARKDKKNKLGTFVSWMCQQVETIVVASLQESLALHGVTARTNMFDGITVKRIPRTATDDLLSVAPFYVEEHTGFRMAFSEKPMAPMEVSELYTAPDIPTLMPTDRLVLLDLDGTLALNKGVRWGFRKGIEALPKMQRDGVKIGLFTNKSRANIPLAEIATATGVPDFKFDVILAGEQCYPPTKAYRRANPGLMKFDKLKSLARYFPEHENV